MGLIDRSPRTVLAVAFVASAALLGGAVTAFVTAGEDGTTVASSPLVTPGPTSVPAPVLTVEPSPVLSPVPSATATATSAPSASPSASASASVSASARPSAQSSATGTPTRYPYPKPSQTYAGLVLSATLDPGSGSTSTTFDLRMKATDGDGEISFDGLVWGDGSSVPAQPSPQKCGTFPPLTSPAGAYQPSPDSDAFRYQHRYSRAGRFRVTANVSSVNKDCKPNGPSNETRTVVFDVVITPAAPANPTPSPSASPTPAPSASP